MTAQPAPEVAPALEVTGLSVTYGGIVAVDDVSFSLHPGGIVGLIGPNGAGKTSIFDAICGFAPLTAGRIILQGEDITELAPAERARAGLGRSFQDGRLFPSLTVSECLATSLERHITQVGPVSAGLRLYGVKKEEAKVQSRVEDLIELMGLGAFRDKFLSELSTGSRRIVDLACVMAHDPAVLLLDEPSSGIAQRETEALVDVLGRVKTETGCGMLVVEHDMPLVTAIAEELIALETGRIVAKGSPADVVVDPRVVEAYLGTDQSVIARSGAARAAKEGPSKSKATKSKPAKKKTKSKPAKKKTKSKPAKKKTKSKPAKKKTKKKPSRRAAGRKSPRN